MWEYRTAKRLGKIAYEELERDAKTIKGVALTAAELAELGAKLCRKEIEQDLHTAEMVRRQIGRDLQRIEDRLEDDVKSMFDDLKAKVKEGLKEVGENLGPTITGPMW
jgi:hypothetical protein